MDINKLRNAWLYSTLATLTNSLANLHRAIFKERPVEPDPGGMRDEMEREFCARASRRSR